MVNDTEMAELSREYIDTHKFYLANLDKMTEVLKSQQSKDNN